MTSPPEPLAAEPVSRVPGVPENPSDTRPDTLLLPVRMLNEHVYCPRLFALEWMNGEWADSVDTVQGRAVHRRVDQAGRSALPEPEDTLDIDPDRPVAARSVTLGDLTLGLIARMDLVEAADGEVVPIDYKKGEAPDTAHGAWDPERVQVCAQGLLLRAHGYTCHRAVLYFAGSKRRVEVPLTPELIALTLAHRDEAMRVMLGGALPPPLVDSPKCVGCSLVGICLPDETNLLTDKGQSVRGLVPPRDDALPLYVLTAGAKLTKEADEIVVSKKEAVLGRARLIDTSRVVLHGGVSVTTPLLHELARAQIPVSFHSAGGWFIGQFTPGAGNNVFGRIAQHKAAADPARSLTLSKAFIRSKILNCRVFLRRNGDDTPTETLTRLKELATDVDSVTNIEQLFGVEGAAARMYFQAFPYMLRADLDGFSFEGRNRRPPRDPINCMLSFAYACLTRELSNTLTGVGLDAWVGFMHQPRPGKPALALDLMEEFRPVICDSVVINAVNNEVVKKEDFLYHPTGVAFKDGAKRRFVEVFERRLDELATHPTFGTRLSYRRILEVQARMLGKVVLGDLAAYPEFRIR